MTSEQEQAGSGEFLDGWSLAAVPVQVRIAGRCVQVWDAGQRELARWDATGLHCDAMQEGVLHVSHDSAPHETLVVRDAALAQVLLSLAARVEALPGGSRKLAFAVCGVGLLLMLGLGFYLGVPKISRLVAANVPLEHERALGGHVEALLEFSRCEGAEPDRALKTLAEALGGGSFEIRIIQHDEPNAFALPGGVILFTDGLFREAESSDEVAGVLAHEIEHVVQRHVLAGVIRDALLSTLWSLTVGDYAGLLVVDPSTAYRIATLGFSREDEAAADRGAIQRLHRAGFSHAGLTRFFERLQRRHGDGGPEWLSTHPDTGARIRSIRAVPDLAQARPALNADQMTALRLACAPR